MSKKSQKLWQEVRSQIEAGTFPAVFVTANGILALDGSAAMLPQSLAELYPAEIVKAAQEKRATFDAEQAEKSKQLAEQLKAADELRQAVIEAHRHKRCWRLNGLYVEEFTERFTYYEISQWIDCEAYILRHRHPSVSIVCERGDEGEFYIDVSGYFDDVCNTSKRSPSFDEMAHRLQKFVMDRRANASENN